jgi:GLPGLI family protein
MRRIILIIGLLTSLLIVQLAFAQSNEGVVVFEERMNMHRRLPLEAQQMKAMIPEYRSSNFQLVFNADESHYKPIVEDEEDPFNSGGNGGVQLRFNAPKSEIYLNQPQSRLIIRQEFMGKGYLIEDSVKLAPWKFGAETKVVQGYDCRQAYYTDSVRVNRNGVSILEKREVTAWYTDKVRPFLGPDRFNTLPGAVLALDINNGERIIVATKIEFRPLKKNELKAPSKGEKTTQAAYRSIVDEQMKKMSANGGMIIRN